MRHRYLPGALLTLFVSAPLLLSGQQAARREGTSLHVLVADAASEAYLLSAHVTLQPFGVNRETDFFGDARFPPLPAGVYTLKVIRRGYKPLSTPVRFSGRDSLELIILLKPTSQELAPVTILESAPSPFLKEFDQRRRQGRGYFLADSALRAAHGRSLEDLIVSKVPGIRIGGPAGAKILYSTRGSNSVRKSVCAVSVYFNGVRVGSDPQIVPLEFIGGIEYYPTGHVPVQYQEPGNDCGVMLLWPRP